MRKLMLLIIFVFMALFCSESAEASQRTTYVLKGEGWVQIAERCGIDSWKALRRLNWDNIKDHRRPNLIYTGQMMLLPLETQREEFKTSTDNLTNLKSKQFRKFNNKPLLSTFENSISVIRKFVHEKTLIIIGLCVFISVFLLIMVAVFIAKSALNPLLAKLSLPSASFLKFYCKRNKLKIRERIRSFRERSYVYYEAGFNKQPNAFYLTEKHRFFGGENLNIITLYASYIAKNGNCSATNIYSNLSLKNREEFPGFTIAHIKQQSYF